VKISPSPKISADVTWRNKHENGKKSKEGEGSERKRKK
jgi:hypothetical protein